MRLLNTSTYKLHEFFGYDVPPYVILSHRWEREEVTFQDLRDGQRSEMQGWRKIVGCCKQAIGDGFEYVASTFILHFMLIPAISFSQWLKLGEISVSILYQELGNWLDVCEERQRLVPIKIHTIQVC